MADDKLTLVATVEALKKTYPENDGKTKNYQEVADLYNDMVQKGLIKKRGYTLRTILDGHNELQIYQPPPTPFAYQ